MTYEQWWLEFIAEHEDWKYADSDALRKAAFKGGQESLHQQLATSQAHSVMLRDALMYVYEHYGKPSFDWHYLERALAATADLKNVILCHAEPVGWCGTSGVGEFIVSKSQIWNFLTTPLYCAWEPK